MDINLYSFLQKLMLLGAFQGIIFSCYTFISKKNKSLSNRFLGLLILWFSLNNIQYYLWKTGIIDKDVFFGLIYFPFASSSMVFYFFYIQTLLFPQKKISKKQWLLLLPCFIFFLCTLCYKFINAFGNLTPPTILFFSSLTYIHEVFSVVFSFVLLIYAYKNILNFEQNQSIGTTQFQRLKLGWIKTISIILFILCFIWMFSIFNELSNNSNKDALFYLLWIGISFTIYTLGHVGWYHFHILQEQKQLHKFKKSHPTFNTPEKIKDSENKIIISFENFVKHERNYLDSKLSLEKVAESININKSYLSRLINIELGKSFSDYVNELRVEEAKQYLAHSDFKNYTLISIGLEAGFNSKTTFNTSFKKHVGMTPSEFRKKLIMNKTNTQE